MKLYMANDILDNPQLPSDHFIITGPSRFDLTPMQKVINLGEEGVILGSILNHMIKNWLREGLKKLGKSDQTDRLG